jgi:hypothetical protein
MACGVVTCVAQKQDTPTPSSRNQHNKPQSFCPLACFATHNTQHTARSNTRGRHAAKKRLSPPLVDLEVGVDPADEERGAGHADGPAQEEEREAEEGPVVVVVVHGDGG